MSRIWKKQASRYVGHYPVFNLRQDVCISPRTGKEHTIYVFETRDWINIIPLTPDQQVVMVRQYRFGSEQMTLETPGGLVDHADPSIIHAARREMLEETGYDSDEFISLGAVRPNPALQNNTSHSFLALNVQCVREQNLDAGEDIQVELVPLQEIPRLILNGTIDHSIVLNAFYLYELNQRRDNPL